ncbi:XRE family transcriptional regulator [Galbibacter sp. PAP.153]|uniref:helix-turn-helix domain-containing protein n=1 Tax=Galbibacter sp. PAP.153 TaxID=3104623 RepID=UPI0030091442
MKELFAKRLKSARILAAISQDELVARIEGMVSKNAISKYERGEMMPNGKVLIVLAKALGVKPDYFFREFNVEIEQIEFRKKSKLGVKRVNAIREKVVDIVERYLELEQFLSIKSEFRNPIAHLVIKNQDDIENAVNLLLKKWKLGLNALPNVIELLEDKEIKVIEIDAPEAFDGFSGWADRKFPVIVLNQNFSIERKRLTALHELGHLLLNFSDQLEHKEVERKCFQFAAAMLIPEETFKIELGGKRTHISLPELVSIKETYGISIQAIMARAKDLGVISEHLFINFRKWISRNKTEAGLGSYIGKENSNRFKQLLYRAASEEVISLSKAANLSNQKLAAFRKEFVAI